jgi:asparagine synthase (glutamine-hydrolysing)
MCGLAGFWTSKEDTADNRRALIDRMTGTLRHRGPDDEGSWVDADCGVALGFRRLAILDLSPLGHQPMTSATGRYTLLFNGEIYNFADLRAELEEAGSVFRGRSDTEVILGAFERWGIAAAVARLAGMFGMAVWDGEERRLTLVRDRLGIKPLFWTQRDGTLLFGSELRALRAHPAFHAPIDADAVAAFLRYLYVPAPRSIHAGVSKLPPGCMLTLCSPDGPPTIQPYWSLADTATSGLASPFPGGDEEAIDELERLLRDVIRQHLQADVPLGTFLSGGIDSSLVTALAQRESPTPVRTFSIAFREAEYNEAHHAARIASHLGTEHTEILLTGEDSLDLVPRMAEIFDEPHADTSQIPAYLVCAAARRHVTVALSGDGGDEVFAGYNRYGWGDRLVPWLTRTPRAARGLLAAGIGALGPDTWDSLYRTASPVLPRRLRQRLAGQKMAKLGRAMSARDAAGIYRSLVSVWPDPESMVPAATGETGPLERVLRGTTPSTFFDRMLLADQAVYLPDDQLAKVDRVSMAVSLEARVPLVDHRVLEFSWKLRPDLKIRGGKGKWALRKVLHRHVPVELVERAKMGLSVPIDGWLRGPLRGWAEELLDERALGRDGLLHAAPIRTAWRRLQEGRGEDALGLWAVLMLQAWRARWSS